MAHARQTIREKIATLLKVTPINWSSVLETRVVPTRQMWPFLMVFATDESAERDLIHATGIYDRSVNINVVGMLKMPGTGDGTGNAETVEDSMDAVADEIETKLTFTALSALVGIKTLALQNTSMDVITNEADGSISHAEITTTWVVGYDTAEGAPSSLI